MCQIQAENFFWGDVPQTFTLPINSDLLVRNPGSATVYSGRSLSDIILSLAINYMYIMNCKMFFHHFS